MYRNNHALKRTNQEILQFFYDSNNAEIAALLEDIQYDIIEEVEEHWLIGKNSTWKLIIKSNTKVCNTIDYLSQYEKDRILKAFVLNDKTINQQIENLIFDYDESISISPKLELLCELLLIKSLLIRIATGINTIQDKNDEYVISVKQASSLLKSFNINFILEFDDLWKWYHFYKDKYKTYKERRHYVNELFKPIIESIITKKDVSRNEIPLTGWDRVDRVLSKTNELLNLAKNEEDFQQIGLLCREVFITLGQILYKPELHKLIDEVNPSQTDAKRLLEIYIENELQGNSNSALRKYLRSAFDLSIDLQHKRTANKIDAGICLEATYSTTNTIKIIENAK